MKRAEILRQLAEKLRRLKLRAALAALLSATNDRGVLEDIRREEEIGGAARREMESLEIFSLHF